MNNKSLLAIAMIALAFLSGCSGPESDGSTALAQETSPMAETPEYFLLRPEVEKAYGYTHAIKIGGDIKISGAVSMDDEGNPTAIGDLEQQMKNAYSDLDKVLKHYGLYLRRCDRRERLYDRHGEVSRGLWVSQLDLHESVSDRNLARDQRPRPARAHDRDRTAGAQVRIGSVAAPAQNKRADMAR